MRFGPINALKPLRFLAIKAAHATNTGLDNDPTVVGDFHATLSGNARLIKCFSITLAEICGRAAAPRPDRWTIRAASRVSSNFVFNKIGRNLRSRRGDATGLEDKFVAGLF